MSDIRGFEISEDRANKIVNFARDAIEVYTKEGQKMDVGSVDDLLNIKTGLFMQIESTGSLNRVRGTASFYGSQRLADAIINSTVYAASDRSLGSSIPRNELSGIKFKIAPITKVKVTEDPENEITLGTDIPVVLEGDTGWLYPTSPVEQNWAHREYLDRTCKKAGLKPDHWENKSVIVAETQPFEEETPGVEVTFTVENK